MPFEEERAAWKPSHRGPAERGPGRAAVPGPACLRAKRRWVTRDRAGWRGGRLGWLLRGLQEVGGVCRCTWGLPFAAVWPRGLGGSGTRRPGPLPPACRWLRLDLADPQGCVGAGGCGPPPRGTGGSLSPCLEEARPREVPAVTLAGPQAQGGGGSGVPTAPSQHLARSGQYRWLVCEGGSVLTPVLPCRAEAGRGLRVASGYPGTCVLHLGGACAQVCEVGTARACAHTGR